MTRSHSVYSGGARRPTVWCIRRSSGGRILPHEPPARRLVRETRRIRLLPHEPPRILPHEPPCILPHELPARRLTGRRRAHAQVMDCHDDLLFKVRSCRPPRP
jgi:hypothetical protein